MLKGFRDFILKGNVIELATAVIVGTAFTAIVTAFSDNVIKPLINAIPGGGNPAEGLGFRVNPNVDASFINIGALVGAIINFLIIAAVVYFVIVVPYNRFRQMRGYHKPIEETEVELLADIRDLLQGGPRPNANAAPPSPGALDPGEEPGPPPNATQRITTAPPVGDSGPLDRPDFGKPQGPPPGPPQGQRPQGPPPGPPQGPPPGGPQGPPPGGPQGQGNQPGGPQGFPTPPPGPGNYPPPGNFPPRGGNYPPPGNFPDDPDQPGRHSR